MSMNINLDFQVNGVGRKQFEYFFQTTTCETEYVLSGCPTADEEDWIGSPGGEVSSYDPEWPGALQRLREVTQERAARYPQAGYEDSFRTIDELEKAAKVPGIQCFIYGM